MIDSSGFFIYICTMIPPIWFVELTRIDQANAKRRTSNSSYEVTFDILESLSGDTLAGIEVDGLLSNAVIFPYHSVRIPLLHVPFICHSLQFK